VAKYRLFALLVFCNRKIAILKSRFDCNLHFHMLFEIFQVDKQFIDRKLDAQ